MLSSSFFAALSCLLGVGNALSNGVYVHDESFTPDYVLSVTRQNVSVAGIQRYSTLINGSSPGPELRLPQKDVIWIRVHNDMNDANLTMHWHGLKQATYPFSDGTPQASQWPIPTQHFFDYELNTTSFEGTYFYHAHVGFQAVSAAGALIIEDSGKPPYEYDGEKVVLLQELFNETDSTIEAGLISSQFTWSGEPNALLINGKGISNYGIVNPSSAGLSVISVKPEQTYRFRFIAGTALSIAMVGFENHTDFKIIAADADYTKPYSVDLFQIGSGQRYDALLTTKSCAELGKFGKRDFYLQYENRDRPSTERNYAVLRYETCHCKGLNATSVSLSSNPETVPITLPPTLNGWLDYKLEPLVPNDFPSASEVTRRIIINAQQVGNGSIIWQDDGFAWTEDGSDTQNVTHPYEPYLVALYKNDTNYIPDYAAAIANGGLDKKTNTFPGKLGEVLEIIVQDVGEITYDGSAGGGLDSHPWHMHGRHFYDIGSGQGKFDPSVAEKQLAGSTPIMRDTAMLYRYNATTGVNEVASWRAWRVRVEDPGVWMVHCHWLQHMIMGMQTVFIFGDQAEIVKDVGVPEVSGYLTYGGDVYGNSTHAPTVVHFDELQ
ncbi:Cupredoxin [Xylariaceae sp. FL0255]|nr:Cupredoxin [Xylariaceae sp. FL0255]